MSDRVEPDFQLPEREMLEGWLDYHRATLLWKCDGLSDEQLRTRAVTPSTMSLLGLVRHMTEVERNWFMRVIDAQDAPPLYYDRATDPDGDFDNVDTADVSEAFATFNSTVDAVRETAARHGLDDTGSWRDHDNVTLRWIYVHMVEEYARHNGHADLIRERIDGATGD